MRLLFLLYLFGSNIIFAQQYTQPNIVIIYADDMGYSDVGIYGELYNTPSPANTPNMDELAMEGMIFTNAHSSSAVCTPSRYGLLTGKYSWRTISSGVSGAYGSPEIPDSDITLAEYLKSKGYQTAAFGKWHLGGYFFDQQGNKYDGRNHTITNPNEIDWEHSLEGHAKDNGFDVFKGMSCTINRPPYVYVNGDKLQYFDTSSNSYRDALNSDSYHFFSNSELSAGLVIGAATREGLGDPNFSQITVGPKMIGEAEEYIENRVGKNDPFFMYVSLYSPHKPWQVTPNFAGSEGFQYGDFMHEVDNRIGRIIDAIDNNGFTNNTIIIVTSDNGPETSAFTISRANNKDPNGPFRGVKRDSWEGGTRVPFIIRYPQIIMPESVSSQLIWQGDIFKTLSVLLGDCLPPYIAPDAANILPILDGSSDSITRDAIVTASINNQLSIRTNDGWKLIDGTGGGGNNTSYDGNNENIHDAIGEIEGSPKQLFYLPDDITEANNLVSSNSAKAIELLSTLDSIQQNLPQPSFDVFNFLPTEMITISAAHPAEPGLQGNFVLRERKSSDNTPNRHISGFIKFDISTINSFNSLLGDRAYLKVKLVDRLNTTNPAKLKITPVTQGNWNGLILPQYQWATASSAPIGPGWQTEETNFIDDISTSTLDSEYIVDVTTIINDWVNDNTPNYGFGLFLSDHFQGVSLDSFKLDVQQINDTECDDSNPNTINDTFDENCVCIGKNIINAKILLEGFYDNQNNNMHTFLNGSNLLPLTQPFNIEPWNYMGNESLNSIPNGAVDWILLMTRDTNGNILDQAVGFVNQTGQLMDINNSLGIPIKYGIGNLFSIHHRSHLAILSSSSFDGQVYDFTTAANQAAGNDQLKLIDGKFMMHSGDYDGNGIINSIDFNNWKTQGAIINQYLPIDGDGNGIINSLDFNLWTNNKSKIGHPIIRY